MTPLNVTIFNTHMRNYVIGATPMALTYVLGDKKILFHLHDSFSTDNICKKNISLLIHSRIWKLEFECKD